MPPPGTMQQGRGLSRMLFQELGKLKRSSIMTSITLMALGIIMVICPFNYTESLVNTLGCAMLIIAAVIGLEFISSKRVMINYIYLTCGLILGILGASVLVFDNSMVGIIGFTFSAALIVSSVIDIFSAMTYARRSQRKGWWILILLSALQIMFGLIVLINPWWNSASSLFKAIGVILLFSCVVSIIRLFFVWPIRSV